MTADQYLHGILLREAVDAGPNSPLLALQTTLMPVLRQWAGDNLVGVYPSGSFMKGTAVRSGTDIDLFLSLSEHTNETLKEVYDKLFDCLTSDGYSPRRQNVSLNITVPRASGAEAPISAAADGTAGSRALIQNSRGPSFSADGESRAPSKPSPDLSKPSGASSEPSRALSNPAKTSGAKAPISAAADGTAESRALTQGSRVPSFSAARESRAASKLIDERALRYSVDLVPGKRQNARSSDHSLYRRRADTWTKTNISTHARTVVGAGRADEIRILKLWRNQKGLDFPSFYLELSVIRALSPKPVPGLLLGSPPVTLAQRVMKVFDYLRDSFPAARIADPANSNNIISDDLTAQEKAKVSAAAKAAREAARSSWEDIVR